MTSVLPAKKRKSKKPKKSVVYDLVQRDRLRNRISKVTCSPYWTELALETCQRYGVPPESKHVASALGLYRIYPPPAENTPMKPCRCRNCKGERMYPAHYIRSSGVSVECAYELMPQHLSDAIEGSVSSSRLNRRGEHKSL